MKTKRLFPLIALFAFVLTGVLAYAADKPQTFTGVVTDAMCGGVKHMPGQTAGACVRACVKQGSQYALVVGDKVFKLDGNTADLDKYAGETASVKGKAEGDTIHVTSVSAAIARKG